MLLPYSKGNIRVPRCRSTRASLSSKLPMCPADGGARPWLCQAAEAELTSVPVMARWGSACTTPMSPYPPSHCSCLWHGYHGAIKHLHRTQGSFHIGASLVELPIGTRKPSTVPQNVLPGSAQWDKHHGRLCPSIAGTWCTLSPGVMPLWCDCAMPRGS